MFYFYVLLSREDNTYYYGSTNDLTRRVHEHNTGKVQSTVYRQPLKLLYYEAYEVMRQARLREKQVKASGSIRKALHERINPVIRTRGQPGLPQGSRR